MAKWPAMSRIGVSGLVRYAGRVFDEWLPELQGPRGRRVFREMADNDPVIGAILFGIEMLVRQVEWTVETNGDEDTAEAEATRQFIEECLHDMGATWPDTLGEIMTMLTYGFSLHEIIYKRRNGRNSKYNDGRIGWADWEVRGQETLDRWEFDDDGQLLGMWQLGPPDWVFHFIPMEKALLFRTTQRRGNPEGRPIIRNAYRPWFFKKHIEVIEGIGVERDLAGLPVMYVPPELLLPNATGAEQQLLAQYKEIVTNTKRDEQEGIVLPMQYDDKGNPLYKFELLSTGGSRQFDTDGIIARYDQRIAMSVLADFIMLGHEGTGSYSLGSDKSKMFTTALSAWIHGILAVVNDTAIPRLLRLNGIATDSPPLLRAGGIDDMDLGAMGDFLVKLTQAGVPLDISPDGPLVQHLMKEAGLPTPPETMDLGALAKQKQMLAQAQITTDGPKPNKPSTSDGDDDDGGD